MHNAFRAAVVAALLPTAAAGQTVTRAPADPMRWDTAIHVGWLGGNKSHVGPGWNDWYDAASVDASAGYYLTSHLKLDLGIGTAAEAAMSIVEPSPLPGDGFPYYRTREHRFRATSVAGGVSYQFLENAWFHPFIGGGVAVIHERERAGAQVNQTIFRDAQTRVLLPPLPALDITATTAHPYGAVGFKAYASERVFFRTDLRVAASKDRARSAEWRAGCGVDF